MNTTDRSNWRLGCLCHELHFFPTRNKLVSERDKAGSTWQSGCFCVCLSWRFLAVRRALVLRLPFTASKKRTFDFGLLPPVSQERLFKRCMYIIQVSRFLFCSRQILTMWNLNRYFLSILRRGTAMALLGIKHWLFAYSEKEQLWPR